MTVGTQVFRGKEEPILDKNYQAKIKEFRRLGKTDQMILSELTEINRLTREEARHVLALLRRSSQDIN